MHSSMLMVLAMAMCASAHTPWYPRPAYQKKAQFARWLIHESNYTIMATSSQLYDNIAYPNLLSVSDGTGPHNCTGQIYVYITSISTMFKDIKANPRVTFGFYEVGEDDKYCQIGGQYDPEDPNCAKAHITGTAEILKGDVAKEFLFWRHPAMKMWPAGHDWVTVSVKIETVDLLDFYGGLAKIPIDEYLKATCQ